MMWIFGHEGVKSMLVGVVVVVVALVRADDVNLGQKQLSQVGGLFTDRLGKLPGNNGTAEYVKRPWDF
jgi:hypothetical protein